MDQNKAIATNNRILYGHSSILTNYRVNTIKEIKE
jgi:hypothetical protein